MYAFAYLKFVISICGRSRSVGNIFLTNHFLCISPYLVLAGIKSGKEPGLEVLNLFIYNMILT